MSTRRSFLKSTLGSLGLAAVGCTGEAPLATPPGSEPAPPTRRPNILLMIVDELRVPPLGYGPFEGEIPQLKEILGFRQLSASNQLTAFFPGFTRLRRNSVVMRTNYIASAACAPSRTTFLTGTYPSVHGVTQTDGIFKSHEEVQWLDPAGVPTVGDWFRAAGYATHYFGKWHASHPEAPSWLEPWGFADWEKSDPEPHGGAANPNGGAFRDPGFADITIDFLEQAPRDRPWLAVCSLVNPHDIAYYPTFWYLGQLGVQPPKVPPAVPAPIPDPGDVSVPSSSTGRTVPLNPDGLPQTLFNLPPTVNEDLRTKPACQQDYAYKMGFALNSGLPAGAPAIQPRPYQLQPDPAAWFVRHGQFYSYLTYLVDLEMRRVLQALDDSGLTEDTIVVFIADHGHMAGAHGGMDQKWHQAYEEAIRVPMVVSSPRVNSSADTLREVYQPTSLIDLVPTLMGLAGIEAGQLSIPNHQVRQLVGANLAPFILGTETGNLDRPGVLYATDDDITRLPEPALAHDPPDNQQRYNTYLALVQQAIDGGAPIFPGPVVRPNRVRCLVTGEWKLVRYFDHEGVFPDQWEMYHLVSDPIERVNLVVHLTGQLRPDAAIPGFTREQLEAQLGLLKQQLAQQEASLLNPPLI